MGHVFLVLSPIFDLLLSPQGAFRMRRIGQGQMICLFIIPEVAELIRLHVVASRENALPNTPEQVSNRQGAWEDVGKAYTRKLPAMCFMHYSFPGGSLVVSQVVGFIPPPLLRVLPSHASTLFSHRFPFPFTLSLSIGPSSSWCINNHPTLFLFVSLRRCSRTYLPG